MKKTILYLMLVLSIKLAHSQFINTQISFEKGQHKGSFNNLSTQNDIFEIEGSDTRNLITTTRDRNGFRIVEQIRQQWSGNEWINYKRDTSNYNNNNLLSESLTEEWENNVWSLLMRSQYSYDDDGNRTEQFSELYIDNEWINDFVYYFSYDNNGLIIEYLCQYWINSTWENDSKVTYLNDGVNCIEMLFEIWDEDHWDYDYKVLYGYDVNNNPIELTLVNWVNNVWLNNFRETSSYNDDILLEKTTESWNNNIWTLHLKKFYSYDENLNLTEISEQIWESSWVDNNIHTYIYDENQNQIEGLYQTYSSGDLINNLRYTNTFDEDNNLIIQIYEVWENEQWVYDEKRLYTFEQYTEIMDLLLADFVLNNYPNPFNPETTISFNLTDDSKIELNIYNIKGQKIKQLVSEQLSAGQHSVVWDGKDSNSKNVASGLYFYKLRINDETELMKKCMLLK